ncbi:MAG: methionyl-tRNA formyltransferase [Candidatus Hydrogenedentes bacterium]|nr:methionyl-tRNA formyltransferase [Candidatus Hydrogenedentota bacterium]
MRIAVAGSGYMATRFVKAIQESKHELCACIQDGRQVRGLYRWLFPLAGRIFASTTTVTGIARRHGIPILYINKMNDKELDPLRALKPDLVLVGGFSIILKKPIIEIPRIGCMNCHSALLPAHRGPNPFRACILSGDAETGVTFHIIDEGIDTGAIVEQHRLEIRNMETAGSLVRRCGDLASEALPELLDRVERDGLHGTTQDTSLATYDRKLKDEDLYLDWKQGAAVLERKVRGCFPYSLARFRYRGRTIMVTRAKVEPDTYPAQPGQIVATRPRLKVATGEGVFVLVVGYTMRPIPWVWPRVFRRPQVGEFVE